MATHPRDAGTATFNAAANDLNQLAIVNGTPWQYDADGNLVNDGRYQYVWDAANRLIGIMDSSTGTVTSFDYDGLGRRLAIGQSDAHGNHAETRYLWCGDELCGARNTSGQILADYYAQGEQHDNYTVSGARETANSYYLRDQIGSVIGVMDGSGNLLGSTDYTSYGMTRSASGQQADMGYAGLLRSPIAGLYLTKYRAYSPSAGRWLSRDPIGIAGGENVYAYVGGDPVANVDPMGESALALPWGLGAAGGEGAAGLGAAALGTAGVGVAALGGWAIGTAIYNHYESQIDHIVDKVTGLNDEECHEEKCVAQEAADEQMCRMATMSGTGARARCWESVKHRFFACIHNRPIPELVIW